MRDLRIQYRLFSIYIVHFHYVGVRALSKMSSWSCGRDKKSKRLPVHISTGITGTPTGIGHSSHVHTTGSILRPRAGLYIKKNGSLEKGADSRSIVLSFMNPY